MLDAFRYEKSQQISRALGPVALLVVPPLGGMQRETTPPEGETTSGGPWLPSALSQPKLGVWQRGQASIAGTALRVLRTIDA